MRRETANAAEIKKQMIAAFEKNKDRLALYFKENPTALKLKLLCTKILPEWGEVV